MREGGFEPPNGLTDKMSLFYLSLAPLSGQFSASAFASNGKGLTRLGYPR